MHQRSWLWYVSYICDEPSVPCVEHTLDTFTKCGTTRDPSNNPLTKRSSPNRNVLMWCERPCYSKDSCKQRAIAQIRHAAQIGMSNRFPGHDVTKRMHLFRSMYGWRQPRTDTKRWTLAMTLRTSALFSFRLSLLLNMGKKTRDDLQNRNSIYSRHHVKDGRTYCCCSIFGH